MGGKGSGRKSTWTQKRAEKLHADYMALGSYNKAGEKHGLSGERVRQIFKRFGLAARGWPVVHVTEEQLDQAAAAPSLQEASRILGCTDKTAKKKLLRSGRKVPNGYGSPEHLANMRGDRRVFDPQVKSEAIRAFEAGEVGIVGAGRLLGLTGSMDSVWNNTKRHFTRWGVKIPSRAERRRLAVERRAKERALAAQRDRETKFRPKKRVVEAVLTKNVIKAHAAGKKSEAWRSLPAWFHKAWKKTVMFASPSTRKTLAVHEADRMVWAEGDDMIVLGHTYEGKLTRMSRENFERLYEPVRRKT